MTNKLFNLGAASVHNTFKKIETSALKVRLTACYRVTIAAAKIANLTVMRKDLKAAALYPDQKI